MFDDTTSGIPHPDKPDHWLVTPWPTDASFGAIVRHFLQFRPWDNRDTARLLAYYEGYEAALDAAPADDTADAPHRRWRADLHDSVRQCARNCRENRAAEPYGV